MIPLDRLKACSNPECRELLPADPARPSVAGFYAKRRDGVAIGFQSYCRACSTRKRREWKDANREVVNAKRREWHAMKMATDSDYRERHIAASKAANERWLSSPEGREASRRAAREYHRRKREKDRDGVNERARMDYALRMERRGRVVKHRETVIDRTQPRVEAGPFVEWLRAYQKAIGADSIPDLASALGIVERRVRALLGGEQARVSVDVVSRALTDARIVVSVGGRVVVTFEDLYGEGGIRG